MQPSEELLEEGIWVEKDGKNSLLYKPLPHQKEFHESTKRFVLLEGGRGGGKSIALRWDAYLRCLTIPRFRALIVRRTMPELKQSHLNDVPMEVAKLGLDPKCWHSTDFVLRFPGTGSSLRFGHVEDEASLTRYLSSEYEWLGTDEVATLSHREFTFLCTSLRSPIPGYVPLVRACTNPVGRGAGWVKKFWIDKNPTYEEAPDYDRDDYHRISCNMDQNPHLDRAAYAKILNNLPSDALRRALRHGEWVIEGQFFSEWADTKDGKPWHVIDTLPTYKGRPIIYAEHIEILRVIDWGYSRSGNPGVCLWIALLPNRSAIVFQEFVFKELLPSEAADAIKLRSKGLRIRYSLIDTACFQEHEGPSIAERIEACGIPLTEADKQRIPGWIALHTWLRDVIEEVQGDTVVRYPRLRFLRDGCPHTIRTLPQMVVDPKDPQDVLTTGVEDDAADCLRYFAQDRGGPSRTPVHKPELDWVWKEIRKRRNRHRGDLPVLRGV